MLPNHDLSFQLWSSRNGDSLIEQLRALKSFGYTDVQPYHDQWDDAAEMKRLLDEIGLTSKTGHVTLRLLNQRFDQIVADAKLLGISLVVAPWIDPDQRPADAAGWRSFGASLAALSKRLADVGLDFAWHNHEFEFVPLADGSYPIEYLLDDELLFEMDAGWIARAGEDPVKWMSRYHGRMPALHVKDLAKPGENQDESGWADLGQGMLPWPLYWKAAVEAGVQLMVIEHDDPSDYRRFASKSAKAAFELAEIA